MKLSTHTFASIVAILILCVGCNKEKEPLSPPIIDMWNCHHESTWDESSTREALIGEWEWEYIGCYSVPSNANYEEFEGLEIEFKDDNTLDVIEDGQIIQTSTWEVVDGDVDLFAVDVEPSVSQLYGRILFCEELVEFETSYIDGCDNYFRRKD